MPTKIIPGWNMITTDSSLDIARGLVPGVRVITIYGRNPQNDAASGWETIWNGGGIYTGHNATGAEIVTVTSASASDSSAGTGAQSIVFYGLNGTGTEISETVVMNGTAGRDTINTYKRFIRAEVVSAGTNGSNVGAITSKQKVTTANIFHVMPIGTNHTAVGAYTIPAGYTGYLKNWAASLVGTSSTATAEFRFLYRKVGSVWRVDDTDGVKATGNSSVQHEFHYFNGELFDEGTDIRIDGDADTNGSIFVCHFCIVLVQN